MRLLRRAAARRRYDGLFDVVPMTGWLHTHMFPLSFAVTHAMAQFVQKQLWLS